MSISEQNRNRLRECVNAIFPPIIQHYSQKSFTTPISEQITLMHLIQFLISQNDELISSPRMADCKMIFSLDQSNFKAALCTISNKIFTDSFLQAKIMKVNEQLKKSSLTQQKFIKRSFKFWKIYLWLLQVIQVSDQLSFL